MLMHACPGCGALVPYGTARCEGCAAALEARRSEQPPRARRPGARPAPDDDPKFRAFYRSKEWRGLSAAFLSGASFRCERCGGVACEVHHDPPIRTPCGWEHRLDPAHLHALCTRCHNFEHARFGGGRAPGGGPKSFGAGRRNGQVDRVAEKAAIRK